MQFIKKQLDKVSPLEWIGIGAAVLGAAAVYWAAITDWFSTPWAPLTIPMVLVIIASVYSIIDRYSQRRARTPFKPLSDNELRNTIQEWLTDYGWTVSYPPNIKELQAAGYPWVINAVVQEPMSLQIAYVPGDSMLTFSTYYSVPNNWWVEFDKLTSDPKLCLLDEITIELAHFELGVAGVVHPLRNIALNDQVLYDETFSKIRFVEMAKHVISAGSAVDAIIRRAGSRMLVTDKPSTDESAQPTSTGEREQSPEEHPDK